MPGAIAILVLLSGIAWVAGSAWLTLRPDRAQAKFAPPDTSIERNVIREESSDRQREAVDAARREEGMSDYIAEKIKERRK